MPWYFGANRYVIGFWLFWIWNYYFPLLRADIWLPFSLVDFVCSNFTCLADFSSNIGQNVIRSLNTLFCCGGGGAWQEQQHLCHPLIGETWHLKRYFKWCKVCEAVESPGSLSDCQGGFGGRIFWNNYCHLDYWDVVPIAKCEAPIERFIGIDSGRYSRASKKWMYSSN